MQNLINPELVDYENPEWTESMLKEAKTAVELFPNLIQTKKVRTFIEYDADIIATFRAASNNWEERINYALRQWLNEHAL